MLSCVLPCVLCWQSKKVVSEKKLKVIKAVLNVDYEPEHESDGSQHGGTQHRPVLETFDEVRVGAGVAWMPSTSPLEAPCSGFSG
jgi:hypothetical protein